MEEFGGTYLEDFLQSLEYLPNIFRRECELMKDIDRNVYEMTSEIEMLETQLKEQAQLLTSAAKSSSITNSAEDSDDNAVKIAEYKLTTTQLLAKRDVLMLKVEKRIAEKKSIAQTIIDMFTQYENKLDSDLVVFEKELKQSGEYEAPRGFPPDTEVAFKSTLDANDRTLVLGQVIQYRSEINSYEIMDIDDKQTFTVPDSKVLPLGQADIIKKIAKGDVVYALYPDTTLLYPSTVVQIPRRSSVSGETTLTVQFFDDEDADGITPMRNVPLKYIVRAPQFL